MGRGIDKRSGGNREIESGLDREGGRREGGVASRCNRLPNKMGEAIDKRSATSVDLPHSTMSVN